jgi:hypothetical protein
MLVSLVALKAMYFLFTVESVKHDAISSNPQVCTGDFNSHTPAGSQHL